MGPYVQVCVCYNHPPSPNTAFTPDENYVFYLLSYHGLLDDVVKESITFVNWYEPVTKPGGGQSPKTYAKCTKLDIDEFSQYEETLFARKFAPGSNIGALIREFWDDPNRRMPVPRPKPLPRVQRVVPIRGT